jgi:hypothetical protein
MSTGELLPEEAREGLAAAVEQLPWDVHADIGDVYLAVLLRGVNWAVPRSHEIADHQARLEMDEPEPEAEPPLNLNYA